MKARDRVIKCIPSTIFGFDLSVFGFILGRCRGKASLSKLLLNEMPTVEEQSFMSACSEQKLSALNVINERFEVCIKNSGMFKASG